MIRLSAGTAGRLGLAPLKTATETTTAYLLSGEGCLMNCAFCPQGSGATEQAARLGRISWPAFTLKTALAALAESEEKGFQRVCLQAVSDGTGIAGLAGLLREIAAVTTLPVSVSAPVRSRGEAAALLAAGAGRLSIALDAVSPEIFSRMKGGSFAARYTLLLDCARRFPGRIATHLICGLGETEEELIRAAAGLLHEGITAALFAFTPLRGTPMAGYPPPPMESYRRVQAALYLLRKRLIDLADLEFERGRLIWLGMGLPGLERLLASGEAFRTGGCPGCNRPYYNERPGAVPYNYPRPLTQAEARTALLEIGCGPPDAVTRLALPVFYG